MTSARRLLLKERQRAVIESCLSPCSRLTYNTESGTVEQQPWQVLVVDSLAAEIVAVLLTSRDLRKLGVTLQTSIDMPRDAIPGALATYIMVPSPENVAWLLKDVQNRKLYSRVSVAFASAASRPLLAALAAQITVPSPITRVLDLYTSFISLEQNLFSLAMPNSYVTCKQIDDDKTMRAYAEPVISGLVSVFVTLGLVPLVRAQPGGPAAAIAALLNDRLRDSLELFRSGSNFSISAFRRPLLLLMDRDFDLTVMLHHTWAYQALIHDVLDLRHNTVVIPSSRTRQEVNYEMDKRSDVFWQKNAGSPFPEVAQAIEEALRQYQADVESINQRDQAETKPDAARSSKSIATSALAAAVASLPELTERKHVMDVHTSIATALLDEINKRTLDTFFELEGKILDHAFRPTSVSTAVDCKPALLELLKGERQTVGGDRRGAGTSNDRLRLFLIFYLVFGSHLTESDVAEYRTVLTDAGISLAPLDYAQVLCGYSHERGSVLKENRSSIAATGSKRALISGLMTNVVSRGYRGIASVAQNAKNIIMEKRRSHACARVLDVFTDDRARIANAGMTEDVLQNYLIFDPKVQSEPDASSMDRMKHMVFADAVLFVIGGGNYVEYEDCLSALHSDTGSEQSRNLIYGATQLLNADQLIDQLNAIQTG